MRIPALRSAAALFLLCVLALPTAGLAGWQQDGNLIGPFGQARPQAIPDGAGGAIVVWDDTRFGSGLDNIYVQRINGLGVAQWATDGVPIATSNDEFTPQIVSDGAGGAIITWDHNGDIYAQRVDANGVVQWTANGVAVCAAANDQQAPKICTDGSGGAIISWDDSRSGLGSADVYVRAINSAGVPQWAVDGVALVTAAGAQFINQIVSDGNHGAVVAWEDNRGADRDIYANHVNSSGSTTWGPNGTPVCATTGFQSDIEMCTDGTGGAIITWEDGRGASNDIYAQRINGFSGAEWTGNGIAICAQANSQLNPTIMADGFGGAFLAWDDARNTTTSVTDIFVQHISTTGASQWTANGVSLSVPGGKDPKITSDGVGGAIVAWSDARTSPSNTDIYARRIAAAGTPMGPVGGTPLCTATGSQNGVVLVTDTAGGAIAFWQDGRASIFFYNTYAQRIVRTGYWGYPAPSIARVRDVPGDQGGQVNLSWNASRVDAWPDEAVKTYTVWRSLSPSSAAAALAAGAPEWRGGANPAAGGMQPIRTQQINQTTYYWQLVHTLNAYEIPSYSDIVPTPFDSTASSANAVAFQVIAHATGDQWISDPATGRSLDNLAPGAPLQLTAQRVGPHVHLLWRKNHEGDLDHYAIYRKTTTGVTPIQPNFLSDAQDTVLTDAAAPGSTLFYIVTAIDAHDNQSAKSNEASVAVLTGVGDTPRSYTLSLSAYPNPFNPRTTVSYTVPSRGRVSIRVYDASGAFVATLFEGDRTPGAYSVEWNGVAAGGTQVSSGIYFARITQDGATMTMKMVLLK